MGENEVNAINPNNNSENKSSTFNLVIGIATLLIALLGATFAYFSATARSAENDVTVKSAYVSISYDGGTEIMATNLIPSTLTVAMNKYKKTDVVVYDPDVHGEIITDYDQYTTDDETMLKRRCVDAKGKEVCYVYQFSVESQAAEGLTTDIVGSIKVNNNQFENLSYVLYEVVVRENEGNPVQDIFGFDVIDRYTLLDTHTSDGYFSGEDKNPDLSGSGNEGVKFGIFPKSPIFNVVEEQEEIVYPVACLFGEVSAEDAVDIKADDTKRCRSLSISNNVKHTYQLVMWLEETGEIQEEQGLLFEGTVTIEVSGGVTTDEYSDGKITGAE